MYFFHFGGNSLRRDHVFLRHLEKTYHPFFELEIGVLSLFNQKRSKKAKKISNRGKKKNFPFPPLPKKAKTLFLVLFSFPGRENFFPIPGRENFFPIPGRENFFPFPGREKVLKRVFEPFWPFLTFLAFETFTRRGNYL